MDFGLSMLAGGLSSAFDTALNYYSNKNLARQEQANTRKNMREQRDLAVEGAYQQIAQSTSALRAAGLSPALASGINPSAPSVSHSTPGHSAGMPHTDTAAMMQAGVAQSLEKSEIDLNKAQTRKLNAEAQGQEKTNTHTESEDSLLNESMPIFLDEMAEKSDNEFIRSYLSHVRDNNTSFDAGKVKAFSRMFFDMSRSERERELEFIASEMNKKVLRMQYDSPDDRVAKSLADQPYAERLALFRQMALTNMNIYAIAADASLTEDRRELMQKQIDLMNNQIRALYHNDPAAMWQASDYGALGAKIVYDGINSAAEGLGFGVGYGAVGVATRGKSTGNFGRLMEDKGIQYANQTKGFLKQVKGVSDQRVSQMKAEISRRYPNADNVKKAQILNQWIANEKRLMNIK